MSNSWDLKKLERQAIGNQEFDDYILNESGILKYKRLKVLDIGCSNGFKTELLFDKYDNIEKIVGIDIDNKAIKAAKDKYGKNNKYSFELKSITDLDDSTKYDIINLSYVLQHVANPKEILTRLKDKLTDRGVIIIKVPDDSFKFCYPDEENLLLKIFELYEKEIMPKQEVTKNTDRYIGKKVYSYLIENGYSDIMLYYSNTNTIGKTQEQRLSLFESSIAFRSAINKNNIPSIIKDKMEYLLNKLKRKFEEENFYYTMSVLYYIAKK